MLPGLATGTVSSTKLVDIEMGQMYNVINRWKENLVSNEEHIQRNVSKPVVWSCRNITRQRYREWKEHNESTASPHYSLHNDRPRSSSLPFPSTGQPARGCLRNQQLGLEMLLWVYPIPFSILFSYPLLNIMYFERQDFLPYSKYYKIVFLKYSFQLAIKKSKTTIKLPSPSW